MGLNRRRSLLVVSAVLLGSALLGFEPVVLRDMTVESGRGRLTVEKVRMPLWSAAWAQSADTISLENVTLTMGISTYRAKRIDFSGVTSSRAELEALVDTKSSESLASRLGKLNARQIAIAELTTEETIAGVRQRGTYRNILAANVAQGQMAEILVEGGSMEAAGPGRTTTGTQGRMTVEDFNAAEFARIYAERAGPQPGPMTRIYSKFTVENIALAEGSGGTVRVARMSGRDLSARPTAESWAGTLSLITAMAEIDKPSEQENVRFIAAIADLVTAYEIGQIEMSGIDASGRAKDGEDFAMKVARIAYTGPANNQPADARIEGMEMKAKDGHAKIASLAFTGFSFQSTLEGVKALKGKPLDQLDAASLRALVPTIGTIRWSGLDFDVPDEKAKGPRPERIRFTVKDFEVTADKPLNGIPTNLRIVTQNLAFPLPAGSQEEGIKPLLDLGYKTVDLSFTTAASWNEPGNELVIREVSTTGADMGTVTLRGTIGGVTKDVFNPDSALAMVALVGASAKTLDLTVENSGLFERYLAQEARKQKKTTEVLRREYGGAAAIAIPALLGGSAQAKAIGQAVARFVAKPGRLSVSAKAKDPAGLGLADFLGSSEPAAILNKLDVTATAE